MFYVIVLTEFMTLTRFCVQLAEEVNHWFDPVLALSVVSLIYDSPFFCKQVFLKYNYTMQ